MPIGKSGPAMTIGLLTVGLMTIRIKTVGIMNIVLNDHRTNGYPTRDRWTRADI
jgi:hypothetical protein